MDKYDKLRELKSMFDSGLLTETEFSNLKNEILFENANKINIKKESNQFPETQLTSNKNRINKIESSISPKPSVGIGKSVLIIIFVIVCIMFGIKNGGHVSNAIGNTQQVSVPSSVSNSNNNSTSQTEHYSEPEIKKCFECRGTGTIICKMCNGTGTNDMGMECSCLGYNMEMVQLGKKTDPYSGPVHPCRACRGTGIDSPREPEPMFSNE